LRLGFTTGLALAAAFLAKLSNLPLIAVAGVFLLLQIIRLLRNGDLRPSLPGLGILSVCALLPMAMWMAWCQHSFGDLTGSALKIEYLGWTNKPLADWFHHPLFTWDGLWYFVSENISSFWQGEVWWHRKPLFSPMAEWIYLVLTFVALSLELAAFLKSRSSAASVQRTAVWFIFACFAAAFAFFALLSVKFDFHNCFYPSQKLPYFVSGRLMLGALVPFMILIAAGWNRAFEKTGNVTRYLSLSALLVFMLTTEIATDWQIFQNEYNWYHLS